ncbi:MAG: MarR family transcriptional regulator [Alphaproteobacteria bacterium]|nr:MAG: MarR family transcriptional regulator [Alphaproteobacteria bacterium]
MQPDEPTTQIFTALSRLSLYLRSASWQQAGAKGLTPTQAEILHHLSRRGPSRPGALADVLGVTPATLSDSAAALVSKGLLARERDPDDARAVRLRLTQAGEDAAASLSGPPEALAAALRGLAPDQAGELLRNLTLVIRALQEARAIPVQRMCATCRFFRPHAHDDAAAPHHCDFVNAAFGDAELRLDCGEHEEAPPAEAAANWRRFQGAA